MRPDLVVLAAVLACACMLPAAAREPSFVCAGAERSAETAVCGSDQRAALDIELARLHRLALNGPHISAPRRDDLIASSDNWHRKLSSFSTQGGTVTFGPPGGPEHARRSVPAA